MDSFVSGFMDGLIVGFLILIVLKLNKLIKSRNNETEQDNDIGE